ncbi:unnamed protein product, partial [Ixodes pacificus]
MAASPPDNKRGVADLQTMTTTGQDKGLRVDGRGPPGGGATSKARGVPSGGQGSLVTRTLSCADGDALACPAPGRGEALGVSLDRTLDFSAETAPYALPIIDEEVLTSCHPHLATQVEFKK